jgi:hypothetical protein
MTVKFGSVRWTVCRRLTGANGIDASDVWECQMDGYVVI